MANLPKWIENERLDSAAMYSAYLQYFQNAPLAEQVKLGHLTFIEHRWGEPLRVSFTGEPLPVPPDTWSIPGPYTPCVTKIKCSNMFCSRCIAGRGGYQFRWYDKRWYDKYIQIMRPGAWTLTEKEDVCESGRCSKKP